MAEGDRPLDGAAQMVWTRSERWPELQKSYRKGLREKSDRYAQIASLEPECGTITLVYLARAAEPNQAIVLRDLLASPISHLTERRRAAQKAGA